MDLSTGVRFSCLLPVTELKLSLFTENSVKIPHRGQSLHRLATHLKPTKVFDGLSKVC